MSAEPTHELAILDDLTRAIVEAEHVDQLADLRRRAEAIRVWAKSVSQSLVVQNRAAELRLLAERKAGKMLSEMRLKGGDRKSKVHDDRLKLKDLGITQNQSKRWQKAASVSDQQFADYVRTSALLGKEITGAGLLRLAAGCKRGQILASQTCQLKAHDSALSQRSCSTVILTVRDCHHAKADLHEVIDHVNMLHQILKPYASGEVENLSKGERRALNYLVAEVRTLLYRVNGEMAPPSTSI